MLDYKLLHAFGTVVQLGSFQAAAKALHITQSAISQRIKLLEDNLGNTLLIRSTPLELTEAGKLSYRHYVQVRSLEEDAMAELFSRSEQQRVISIAVNNDSIYYWFNSLVPKLIKQLEILLDIRVADETRTHELLRDGQVNLAITSHAKATTGCKASYLGKMTYLCIGTKAFKEKYLSPKPKGKALGKALSKAPHLVFDRTDMIQQEFLQTHFSVDDSEGTHIYLPSTGGFVSVPLAGAAWGLVPEIDALPLIEKGKLVDLTPGLSIKRELYLHSWHTQAKLQSRVAETLINLAHTVL